MKNLISSRKIDKKNIWHDVMVLLLITLLFFLPSIMFEIAHMRASHENVLSFNFMPMIYVLVFLINYYYIVGKTILSHKNFWWFLGVNVVLIVALSFLAQIVISFIHCQIDQNEVAHSRPRHHRHEFDDGFEFIFRINSLIRDGVMMLLSAGFALAFKLSKHSMEIHHKELEINAERRQIEIMSLKAQLNPHFLFNTFNNIYSLISFAPEKAQKAIHDLSSMLRFMIYESSSSFVSLEKELMFVNDYIELMKLRLNPSMDLRVSINKEGISGYEIAPLLFLTIIENAFKHGTTGDPNTFIHIDIHMRECDWIVCTVHNSARQGKGGIENVKNGVGLENIKKQLNLLYSDKHRMEITTDATSYKINLEIKIHKNSL